MYNMQYCVFIGYNNLYTIKGKVNTFLVEIISTFVFLIHFFMMKLNNASVN